MSPTPAPRILVAPLNWGLGHTTRCIPIIRELERQGATVILMGTETQLTFLEQYFPQLEQQIDKSRPIRYSSWLPAWFKIILQASNIQRNIQEEYSNLPSIVKTKQIDAIVSDNRYGLHSNDCFSVLITHQLRLSLPAILKPFRWWSNRKLSALLRPFHQLWLPDFPDHSLSGTLSHSSLQPKALGCLSRFESQLPSQAPTQLLLALLSGPEPQRSLLLLELLRISTSNPSEITIVIDEIPDVVSSEMRQKWHFVVRPNDAELQQLIQSHRGIICRSGYSTLMDLQRLGRTALLVPTPGQTEQEYLARHWEAKGFTALRQSELKGIHQLPSLMEKCPIATLATSNEQHESAALLAEAVGQLVQRISIKTNNSRRTDAGHQ